MSRRDTPAETARRSDSTLKRRTCMLCDQSLYQIRKHGAAACASFPMVGDDKHICFWATVLHKPRKAP